MHLAKFFSELYIFPGVSCKQQIKPILQSQGHLQWSTDSTWLKRGLHSKISGCSHGCVCDIEQTTFRGLVRSIHIQLKTLCVDIEIKIMNVLLLLIERTM